jgi:hypothetical protein
MEPEVHLHLQLARAADHSVARRYDPAAGGDPSRGPGRDRRDWRGARRFAGLLRVAV